MVTQSVVPSRYFYSVCLVAAFIELATSCRRKLFGCNSSRHVAATATLVGATELCTLKLLCRNSANLRTLPADSHWQLVEFSKKACALLSADKEHCCLLSFLPPLKRARTKTSLANQAGRQADWRIRALAVKITIANSAGPFGRAHKSGAQISRAELVWCTRRKTYVQVLRSPSSSGHAHCALCIVRYPKSTALDQAGSIS